MKQWHNVNAKKLKKNWAKVSIPCVKKGEDNLFERYESSDYKTEQKNDI